MRCMILKQLTGHLNVININQTKLEIDTSENMRHYSLKRDWSVHQPKTHVFPIENFSRVMKVALCLLLSLILICQKPDLWSKLEK